MTNCGFNSLVSCILKEESADLIFVIHIFRVANLFMNLNNILGLCGIAKKLLNGEGVYISGGY